VLAAVAAQQVEVELAVLVVEKDGLAVIPPLSDVMPAAGQHDARKSSHLEGNGGWKGGEFS
jgi:hypothetical protein